MMLRRSAMLLLASTWILSGCGSAPQGDASWESAASIVAGQAAAPASMITFSADWTQLASEPLVAGQSVGIAYDPARLVSSCGGSVASGGGNGGFAWQIWGYYAVGNEAPVAFPVTITSAWASGNAQITPPVPGDLQLWFGCGNTSGNTGWDSAFGHNYHFQVNAQGAADGTGSPDTTASTGTVQIQVVADAVVGNAGSVPPDTLSATPISGVSIYDGPWEAGGSIGTTDANGQFSATLPIGSHQIGVMMMTSSHSLLSSDGNAVDVTTTPGKLVIHVAPTTVQIATAYDAGMGNAIYVTGETSYLGNWTTAYKLTYQPYNNTWTFTKNLPLGAQFKLILAPWVDGDSISVSSADVKWASGNNDVVTPPYQNYMSVLTITPSF